MESKNLVEIVREQVMKNLLHSSKTPAGSDLNHVMFSFVQVKEILYSTLMEIEISDVKERWGGK
jgi:hypothetical protein